MFCVFVDENKCVYWFYVLNKGNSVYFILVVFTVLIFSSILIKVIFIFFELLWRLYFSVGKSCFNNGWFNLLFKIIGRYYKKGEI